MGENKKYVVYGMKAKCSEGTMENFISTKTGHGIVFQGQPVLNANDHVEGINLTHFGDCNSKEIYEQARKEADEKFQAGEGDGFFMKAAKKRAKRAVKAVAFMKEHLMFNKCELDTPLPWVFTSEDHMIDGAPALTLESQCACRYGGIITIVLEAEEVTEEEELTAEKVSVEPAPVLAPADFFDGDGGKVKGAREDLVEIRKEMAERREIMKEMKYIYRYVNEKALKDINETWDMATLQERYDGRFFEVLQKEMYEVGITDERSILMFLSTIGTECWYGTGLTEKYDERYFDKKDYTMSTRGAGLIHVTGKTQENFMKYLYNTLPEGEERDAVKKYLDEYEIISENGIKKTNNRYETTEPYINEDGEPDERPIYASEFIADNYSIESAVWFWGINKEKVAIFEWNEETQRNNLQIDMTIDEYIGHFENANQDNLFLAVQYAVNGRQKFKKSDLEYICKASEDVWEEGKTMVSSDKRSTSLPNNWEERRADWDSAKEEFLGVTDGEKP